MKHTKGPWHGGKEAINDEQGRLLANVLFKGVSGDIPTEEGHANSALMAAAPDMLEALRNAESILVNSTHPRNKYYHGMLSALKMIREAIAKAEGKA